MASTTETNCVIAVKSSPGKMWVEMLHCVFGIIPSRELIAFNEDYNLGKARTEQNCTFTKLTTCIRPIEISELSGACRWRAVND